MISLILQWFQSFQMLHHRVDKPSWQIPFQHTIGTPVFAWSPCKQKLSLHPKRPKIRASCSAMIQNTGFSPNSPTPLGHTPWAWFEKNNTGDEVMPY